MGGKLFNMKRMTKEQYNNVISELEYLFLELKFNPHFPVVLSDKETFGDIDIILNYDSIDEVVDVLKNGNMEVKAVNGTSLHVYDAHLGLEFQMDCIHSTNEMSLYKRWYYSYGDMNNLIGKMANFHGLKLKDDGLYYRYSPHNDIFITNSIKDICAIFDVRTLSKLENINTENLFYLISRSKYFDYIAFDFDNMNHRNRKRNQKRPMFLQFQEYLKDNKLQDTHVQPKTEILEFISSSIDESLNEKIAMAHHEQFVIDGVNKTIGDYYNSVFITLLYGIDFPEAAEYKKCIKNTILSNIDNTKCSFYNNVIFSESESRKVHTLLYGSDNVFIEWYCADVNEKVFVIDKTILLRYNNSNENELVFKEGEKYSIMDILNKIRKWKK